MLKASDTWRRASLWVVIVGLAAAAAFLFWPGQVFPSSLMGLLGIAPWLTLWLIVAVPARSLSGLLPGDRATRLSDQLVLGFLALAVVANALWLAYLLQRNP